ncbi:hypothetical protein MMC07_009774 [Pseudocyphellaria aurata]|nr:hypothetical protein [Pseudocyphellaria aurata]
MAALSNCLGDCSVAVTGKVEPVLFRLPLELRQQIYAIIFGPQRVVDILFVQLQLDSWSRFMIYREKLHTIDYLKNDKDVGSESEEKLSEGDMKDVYCFSEDFRYERRTGILEVSRALSNEALDVLYGQNIFVVDIHGQGYHKLLKFNVANLRRVHYLRIVARPMGVSYGRPLVFDPQLWLPLLEGLQQFCIVAQQPLVARGYDGAPTLEEDLCEWTIWLDPILKYFSANLPKTTVIDLDDDGRAETTTMMDEHFGPGYQKVRTITGDLCFERGQYSRESGYWDSDGLDGCNFADGGMGDDWSD